MKSALKNWEQVFFALVGLTFLAFSLFSLWNSDIAGASAAFAMSFLSFIYSNLARFKRFKGLGFEAELWEEKQNEAEQLVDRLKALVSIYTREIVLGRVMRGRWGDEKNPWYSNWALYDDLVESQTALGPDIDTSEVKRNIDRVFVFDIVRRKYEPIRKAISEARSQARSIIQEEFGNPVTDVEGHNRRNRELADIKDNIPDMFELTETGDLADIVLRWAQDNQKKLLERFGVAVKFEERDLAGLRRVSGLHNSGPIVVTDELIKMCDRD